MKTLTNKINDSLFVLQELLERLTILNEKNSQKNKLYYKEELRIAEFVIGILYDYNYYYDTTVFSTAALMSNIVISIMIIMLEFC